jgi:hypothetical protein
MKQSCLTNTQERENKEIDGQALNNQAFLVFSF